MEKNEKTPLLKKHQAKKETNEILQDEEYRRLRKVIIHNFTDPIMKFMIFALVLSVLSLIAGVIMVSFYYWMVNSKQYYRANLKYNIRTFGWIATVIGIFGLPIFSIRLKFRIDSQRHNLRRLLKREAVTFWTYKDESEEVLQAFVNSESSNLSNVGKQWHSSSAKEVPTWKSCCVIGKRSIYFWGELIPLFPLRQKQNATIRQANQQIWWSVVGATLRSRTINNNNDSTITSKTPTEMMIYTFLLELKGHKGTIERTVNILVPSHLRQDPTAAFKTLEEFAGVWTKTILNQLQQHNNQQDIV